MVKGFLDEKTTKKITVMGSDFKERLCDVIDKDKLPEFLGGTCTCADAGGDCLTANKGPWSDYEIIKTGGIRKKDSGDH